MYDIMFKIRIITFFILLGLFSAAFQIGSISDVSKEEADALMSDFQGLISGVEALGIFLNNISAALPMFIPGVGVAWGLYTAWSTGFAFTAIISGMPGLENIPPLAILYVSPFGAMELIAYSIGLSRSCHLTYSLIKRSKLKSQIKPTLIEIGIVIGLLLAAGFLEEYMIKASQIL
jgi:hypothetical protein